jgi:hypothetical protein
MYRWSFMIAIRYPMAAASALLICSVVSGQQSFQPQPALIAPLRSVDSDVVDESWNEIPWELTQTIESASDREAGSDGLVEVVVEQPIVNCQCGTKACHGVCTDPGRPRKPIIKKPGDRDRGDCPPKRYCMPDCKRAGNPHCVAPWARCSVNEKYSSWFVGGGTPFARGRCRTPSEGTWGLDYGGFFGHAKVWLNYTRHGRTQGGEGAYQTDGEPAFVSKAHSILGLGH